MNRLFVRTLATILSAVLILVALLAALTILGLQRSIDEWDKTRSNQLKTLATQILRDRPAEVTVPGNDPLFVYDANGNLVFSNRRQGARPRTAGEPHPILVDGRLLGSYQVGNQTFRNDKANTRFLESLDRSLWLALALSLAVAVVSALFFSRRLSAPAVRMASALDRITRGDLATEVPPEGAREIAMIGDSANRLRMQLQREQDLRRQWVQDVAHDLRTPVAALWAQLEAMRDGVLTVSTERFDKVMREVGRVRELVADLEELMRLESPETRVSVKSLDIRDLVEEIRDRFAHILNEKKIQFRAEVPTVKILADPRLIQRAVSNFLANAVRHCPEGGSVAVTVELREDAVHLCVMNSGDPIPPQDLDRVFDRLFRGERARNTAGSGLGLTIARRIAQLHGGDVSIANRPDGVIVEMQLPFHSRT